jgi:hypothetical protein
LVVGHKQVAATSPEDLVVEEVGRPPLLLRVLRLWPGAVPADTGGTIR